VPNSTTHIVDYGLGNIMSVYQGLEAVGSRPLLTAQPEEVLRAERLILPGVGAFGVAMKSLQEQGLSSAIQEAAHAGVPILGICLGMQLLFDTSSEFGATTGLGLISGGVSPLVTTPKPGGLRTTHVGWRSLRLHLDADPKIAKGVDPLDSYYFVHSFAATPARPEDLWGSVTYGEHSIAALVGSGNVWGSQFHPEKSGAAGLTFLGTFVNG